MVTKPEKYTEEFVKQEVESLLNELLENKDICYTGELFENRGYSLQRYSEWKTKFHYNDEISESCKRIDTIIQSRVNVGALKGKLNATMAIFNLKNNHGWKDSFENKHTGGIPVQIVNYQDDNNTLPVSTESISASLPEESGEVQDSGVSSESGEVSDLIERADQEGELE